MPIIKNLATLTTTPSRRDVLEIIEVGTTAVLPENLIKRAVEYDAAEKTLTVNGDVYRIGSGRIFVVGGGKASGLMAKALEGIIRARNITGGIVNSKGSPENTQKIRIVSAGHPIPDESGVSGVREMLDLKQHYSIGENDIVIALISGGGSALLPCPVEGITLEEKQETTRLLINSGAEIAEINAVRKHLSAVKGGRLGSYFHPATVISLILSDVIGNDLTIIASGPTVPDTSTFADAFGVLEHYGLTVKVPRSVINLIEKGSRGEAPETCKNLDNCRNYIIGDNRLALEAMREKAVTAGYNPYIITAEQKGEAGDTARLRAGEIIDRKYPSHDILLCGGETTVRLPAQVGKGGRNQHYAAVSMTAMEPYPGDWVIAAVGTDGSDYLPDIAGAIVDRHSLETAQAKKLDVDSYLERYDSYTLLDKIGNSLIITGDTGTNVGDVIVYLVR